MPDSPVSLSTSLFLHSNAPSSNPFDDRARLGVDLAYADEGPSKRTSMRRFFVNLWAALKRWRLFVKLACIDIRRHTGSFVLSFFSVVVVVLICVVMLSILSTAPVIFQRLAEGEVGQLDFSVFPGTVIADSPTLNYTAVKSVLPLADNDIAGYHAPRVVLDASLTKRTECAGSAPGDWWYPNASSSEVCTDDEALSCLVDRCETVLYASATVILYEPELEARMGYNADVALPEIDVGQVLISERMATLLDVEVGDEVLLIASWGDKLACMLQHLPASAGDVIIPAVVAGLLKNTGKKFPDTTTTVVLPYAQLGSTVATGVRPLYSQAALDVIAATPTDECVTQVNINLPASQRDAVYRSTDYTTIQRRVSAWATQVTAPLGPNQLAVTAPVLDQLYYTRMFSVFVGLIVWVIILALVFFSIVLIYSLINVNLETRMYELGTQRMIGFTRADLVLMVLVNTYFFTIPGWLAGLGLGQVVYLGVRAVFASLVDVQMEVGISAASVGWGTLIGLCVPLVASLFPILALVTMSLPVALDASRRPGASGVVYTLKRRHRAAHRGTVFVLGLLFAVFGVLIYYLFPLSLLKMNLSLMFYIFFAVLIGMLIGLTLLALNLENMLELVVLYACLFWESSAVFKTIRKGLTAHRLRNRKTTLMYALSVAFIIFITVAFDIQFTAFRFDTYQAWGTDVRVLWPEATLQQIGIVEMLLRGALENMSLDVPEMTYQLGDVTACRPFGLTTLQSPGRYSTGSTSMEALPPNFFEVMQKRFLRVNKQRKSLTEPYSLVGALYSADDGNRVLLSSSSATVLGLRDLDDITLVTNDLALDNYTNTTQYTPTVVQAAATLDGAATVVVSPYLSELGDFVASLPLAARLSGEPYTSVACFTADKLSLNGNGKQSIIMPILRQALAMAGVEYLDVSYVDEDTDSLDLASNILNLFLLFALLMILIICFFSLMSTMTTNVFNDSKEIGVFLCLGMSHFQLHRIYLWEAFVLVFASGLLGLAVGVIVAYTMQMQNALLTQLPIPYSFPYIQLLIIIAVGFISAFLASFSPVKHLLGMPSITHILRRATGQ